MSRPVEWVRHDSARAMKDSVPAREAQGWTYGGWARYFRSGRIMTATPSGKLKEDFHAGVTEPQAGWWVMWIGQEEDPS